MVAAALPVRVLSLCHEALEQNPKMEMVLDIIENMTMEIAQGKDGRWMAEMPKLQGVMACGSSKDEAISRMKRVAFRMLY